jgi:hypothetical protein
MDMNNDDIEIEGILFLIALVAVGVVIYHIIKALIWLFPVAGATFVYCYIFWLTARSLFTRYRHTPRSVLVLSGVGAASYILSIFIVRGALPDLDWVIILLLSLIPGILIFLLVGVAMAATWSYGRYYGPRSEIGRLRQEEDRLRGRLNEIYSEIQGITSRIEEINTVYGKKFKEMERLEMRISDWIAKDPANRTLVVNRLRGNYRGLCLRKLNKLKTSLETKER